MSSEKYMYTTTQDLEHRLQQQQPQIQQQQIHHDQKSFAQKAQVQVLKEHKTSSSHPINISWIIPSDALNFLSVTDFPNDFDLYDYLNPSIKEKLFHLIPTSAAAPQTATATKNRIRGNLCLSSCPGKKVRLSGPVRGRAAINRDLDMDFARMKSFSITMLVCCLDDTELDFLGASWPKYEAAAKAHGLQIIRLPMVEGGCPRTLSEVSEAVRRVNVEIYKGHNVLVHCRGGVGRAGLFAGCWLLENLLCKSVERVVYVLREQRSPKAIETITQVEYLIKYSMAINKKLGIKIEKTKRTDLTGEIIQRTPNGAPSIPLIAKLENEVLIDPDIILKDGGGFLSTITASSTGNTNAETAATAAISNLSLDKQQQQNNRHPWW